MHVAVFGAGSIGGYVGARLADRGLRVTLVDGWAEHVEAIRARGIEIIERDGKKCIPVSALHLSDVHSLRRAPPDVIILSVKSYDTAWMTTLAREVLREDAVIVSLQNGMNEDVIAGVVGRGRVIGCTLTRLGSGLVEPGVIRRTLYRPSDSYAVFRVGEVDGAMSQRAEDLARLLDLVDRTKVTLNLRGERWSKLTQNAMASGISPLTSLTLRDLFGDEDLTRIMVGIADEGIRVGRKLGYELEKICAVDTELWVQAARDPSAFRRLQTELEPWRAGMADGIEASTLHDIRRSRRTEIESINGAIAGNAAGCGIDAPLNRRLTEAVLRMEQRDGDPNFIRKGELFELLDFHPKLETAT